VVAVLVVFAFAPGRQAAKEKAARAITGRLVPQLPTQRRSIAWLISAGPPPPKDDGSGPSSQGRLAGTFAALANPND